jgi:uridine phosphorylase
MPSFVPIVLRPHADVAERVLLPGDPGRALRLAQLLVEPPLMLNHNRGLWGYTGAAADGLPLTIQSTGLGGPSAAIVVEELIELGARRLVRVGTCRALGEETRLGELIVAEAAIPDDGASRALGADDPMAGDAALLAALRDAAGEGTRSGLVASSDLLYDPDPGRAEGWTRAGALAVDLTAAAVLSVAARHGLAAGCVLVVTDTGTARLDQDALEALEPELGRVGAAALA